MSATETLRPSSGHWVDHGVVPPARLPVSAQEAALYLTEALGHPVYERWTWTRLVDVFGALPDARRAKPAVCRRLIDAPEVVEAWQGGRLKLYSEAGLPSVDTVVASLLAVHGKRFRRSTGENGVVGSPAAVIESPAEWQDGRSPLLLDDWLRRRGRLANLHADTNSLGANDDHAAVAAFLRERAAHSRHTWRAYTAELNRLLVWCVDNDRGPLSDLTRQDLLSFRDAQARRMADQANTTVRSARSQARTIAVVASLYRYWHTTGYLMGNPAAGVTGASAPRSGFTPTRFVSAGLLQVCDRWVTEAIQAESHALGVSLTTWRRAAVWMLYRYSGARLAELAWRPETGLPRLIVDPAGSWTLQVVGKGNKERPIPLPRACDHVLRGYRLARGLSAVPTTFEQVPLIHGEKRSALGVRGLYDEVKAVLTDVAQTINASDPDSATILRSVSPHWLRHAYARTLVVDHAVPLPVAQALMGHASVQTTAEYAKADLSKLREFVERGFAH